MAKSITEETWSQFYPDADGDTFLKLLVRN